MSNLGPRERTRQEVLWEIVASEERYVAELLKMKETFIDPLLHPFASLPPAPATPDVDYSSPPPHTRAELPSPTTPQPQESLDHLPIAARFLSPLSFEGPTIQQQQQLSLRLPGTPIIEGESDEEDAAGAAAEAAAKMNHPRSPYRHRPTPPGTLPNHAPTLNVKIGTTSSSIRPGKSVPFPSRSHHSLPPPSRAGTGNPTIASANPNIHPAVSSVSLDERDRNKRDHTSPAPPQDQGQNSASRISRKLKKSQPNVFKHGDNSNILANNDAVPPHVLPDDLRRCLEVIENGIVNGHFLLSEGLRKRYEEQYPLVRSLADVFVSHVSSLVISFHYLLTILVVTYSSGICHICFTS